MVERSGYTSLDILDGDCVRPPTDKSRPPVKQPSQLRQGHLSLGNFFHNEDDSPLLVTSIDGISTQSRGPSGPASLSSSTFSLLTPDTPQFFVKSRTVSPAKESFQGISPATPYNSIRKRLKSVSIKYLKSRQQQQKKKPENVETSSVDESSSFQNKFDFLNIDSKLREISEKCSQLKSEAEESISRLEETGEEDKEKTEDFSITKTEAQIEYNKR